MTTKKITITVEHLESFILGVIALEENLHGKMETEKGFEYKVCIDERGAIIHFNWQAGEYNDNKSSDPTLEGEPVYETMNDKVFIPNIESIDYLKTAAEISEVFEKAFMKNYFYDSKEKMFYEEKLDRAF